MGPVRAVALVVEVASTLACIAIGTVCLAVGDARWWLLPAGVAYLLTFGAAGRALWRRLNTPKRTVPRTRRR